MTIHLCTEVKLTSGARQEMPQQIAVAWSGGADSTALLLRLLDEGYAVQAWHIDHGWHEDSMAVAQSLAGQAEEWGVPYYLRQIEKPQKNIESEARSGRYNAFEELAEQTGCFHLALGHHADDQAETVCMRMLQGAGVAGCQGMRGYRQRQNLHLWRPFLQVPRTDIEQYLTQKGLSWVSDPSNEDVALWRNKIRHKLFPAFESKGVSPLRLYSRWQKQAEKVQRQVVSLAQDIAVEKHVRNDAEICVIDWQQWCAQPAPVRAYLLQQMVGLLFAEGVVLGRRHILAIEQWRGHGGNSWLNLSGCCLYRVGKGLQLCKGKMSLRQSYLKSAVKG